MGILRNVGFIFLKFFVVFLRKDFLKDKGMDLLICKCISFLVSVSLKYTKDGCWLWDVLPYPRPEPFNEMKTYH